MRYWILISLGILFYCFTKGDEKKPTIPLNKTIRINITAIDSTTLGTYIIYVFDYKERKAEFLALRNERIFHLGKTNVQLCKATSINSSGLIQRSCRGMNGLFIMKDDSTVQKAFSWDEFSKFPTLRYCETAK